MTIPRNLSFLAQGASATGVLSVPYGGTGVTSITAGYIPYGNGTGAFNSSSSLYFDGTNLGVGTTSTVNLLTVANASNQNDSYGNIQAVYTGTTTSANSSVTVKNYQVTGQFMAWDTIGMRIGSRIVTNTGQGNIIFTSGNDSEFMRGFASGGLSIGNTTDPGATNLSVSGNVTASNLQGPSFSAYQSATFQTISSATNTLVVIDAKEFDTKTCFNNTASSVTLNGLTVPAYAFCPNIAGYYQVTALIGYYQSWTTTTASISAIYKNGSLFKNGPTIVSSYPLSNFGNVSALVYLNGTGDYIQFYSYITVGTTTFNQISDTYFQAVFVQ